jgi:aspartate aminotransferase/aminotransferase
METLLNQKPMPFNPVVEKMIEATSIYINQLVYDLKRQGADVTTLSLGEAFFDIPLFDITKIDVARGFHYSESQGLPELRDKIAGYYRDHYDAPVDGKSQVLISAGSKPIIFMAMMTALSPEDEVLIYEPTWLSYAEQARLCGAVPIFLPFDSPVEELSSHFTDRTRMVILCNPNNPAGRIYSAAELRRVYEVCRPRGIYVLVDEAYSDFVLDEPFASMANVVPDLDGVIVVNSLSKNMGISGWRIGYAIAAAGFIKNLLKLNQHIITCGPTLLLQYCNHYFDDIIAVTLPQVQLVVEKRRRVAAMMDELGIDRLPGSATFYFFVNIGEFPGNSTEFALRLLREKHIAVVPGVAYGASTDRFVRMSIGCESEERIWEALQVIKDFSDAPAAPAI